MGCNKAAFWQQSSNFHADILWHIINNKLQSGLTNGNVCQFENNEIT